MKNQLSIIILFSLAIGCQVNEEAQTTSSPDLKEEIQKQVDSLYEVYTRFDYDWIEFYDDEYTAIYPESEISLMNKDSLKAQWERIYNKYNVKLLDRGKPSIIESQDMAISYNSFDEIFVNKETNDTIKNVGTYIIAWKRKPDNSWKIVFETLHNN